MPRRRKYPRIVPTDGEIAQYDNVPVIVAAKYLGISVSKLYYALQDGRAPFGFAAMTRHESHVSYTYHISPGMLINYKRGGLSCPSPGEVMRVLMDAVQDMLANDKIIKITPAVYDDNEAL